MGKSMSSNKPLMSVFQEPNTPGSMAQKKFNPSRGSTTTADMAQTNSSGSHKPRHRKGKQGYKTGTYGGM